MSARECQKLHAFVAGELGPTEAAVFRDHLGACASCARELHGLMMVEALEQTSEAGRGRPGARQGGPAPVRPFRARLARVAPPVLISLLAAAAWAFWSREARHTLDAPAAVASLEAAPTRPMEVRLAYAAADAYRPYDVARSSAARPHEDVPLATLAALEAKGDLHGAAAGLVLSGDDARASAFLARAPSSPDVEADRAAVLLDGGKARDALELLDRVLSKSPQHPQALYNRALALRDLDAPLAAAEAFDRVAALGERGWAGEAGARAAALRSGFEQRRAAWKVGNDAGTAMAAGGPPLSDEVIDATPELARGYLYQAIRTAPSRARVLELAPLASRLDARLATPLLASLVARVATEDFGRRAPLAATYARIFADEPMSAKAMDAYLGALRAAHEGDLLLGAIEFGDRLGTNLDEYERLATASRDPWFTIVASSARATSLSSGGDWLRAEYALRSALDVCRSAHVEWKCATVERDLAWLLVSELRTTEAGATARAGLAHARAFAPYLEPVFQYRLADVARFEGDYVLLGAHAREAELESPDDCELMRATHLDVAAARAASGDVPGAVAALDATSRCDQPITLSAAAQVVDVVRLGGRPAAAGSLAADLAAARAALPLDERLAADTVLARLTSVVDQAAGERQARAALDAILQLPAGDPLERDDETYARRTIAFDDARLERSADAFAQIAAAVNTGREPLVPGPCALGVATDGTDLLALARDEGGETTLALAELAPGDVGPGVVVPASVRAKLVRCPSVSVYAMPPLHGLPGLLPPSVAWAYVSSAPRASAPREPRRVVVSDVSPPESLGLPRLATGGAPPDGAAWVHGAEATPANVLARIAGATEVEIDAHGIVDAAKSSASSIALSPDASGRFALSASDLAPGTLAGYPVVVLGACHAARTAAYLHQPWSLPSAFVRAGARAVFASPDVVQDAEARPFFDGVLSRIRSGAEPAVALRDERSRWLARDPKSWVAGVMVFE